MKHAGPETLQALAPLLARLRMLPCLVERTPGCFYRGSKAFLHFHDDPAGIHADVKLGVSGFTRLRVASAQEHEALMTAVANALLSARR